MSYNQKAVVYTYDDTGGGKVVYWEDDNGKVTKKSKKFASKEEMDKICEELGVNKPGFNEESFFDFRMPSAFDMLNNFTDGFFGRPFGGFFADPEPNLLPSGVDINQHRQRLHELHEKKMSEERAKQESIGKQRFMQSRLEELKAIRSELMDGGDQEGVANVEKDIRTLEEEIRKF